LRVQLAPLGRIYPCAEARHPTSLPEKLRRNGCWGGLLTLFGSVPELEGRNAWRNMTLRSSEVARVGTWARFAPVNLV
jgi:hypothetical protein